MKEPVLRKVGKLSEEKDRSERSQREGRILRRRKKYLRKFLHYFPGGYQGKKYMAWERDYKWNAHLGWVENLNKKKYQQLLDDKAYTTIAQTAVRLESKTNLLFSFEKMALRDAVKEERFAKLFAEGLYHLVYSNATLQQRFEAFRDMLALLPVKQTRVLTWPLLTVFGFIADPAHFIFLKPTVTRTAAMKYEFEFNYSSKPKWETYKSLLAFADQIKKDTASLKPRDLIDIQSFIWVTGSEEYPD